MKIRLVKTKDAGFKPLMKRILARRGTRADGVEQRVDEILAAVQKQGDRALLRYTEMFDRVHLTRATMEVKAAEIERALTKVPGKDLSTLRLAAKRIAVFHRCQLQKSWHYRDPLGMRLGQRITALERVGVYVPAGKALYPSTVLMNVIPAKVAGVKEIIMTSPIGNQGALILAAAHVAGVDRIFRVGGAQAVAALAFGTRTIPKVDKIVGPGNIFVATAKRLVFGEVDIDSIAGPSEILLLADNSSDPVLVAADMLSQAEHDELAAALCVTTSLATARKIQTAIDDQLRDSGRQTIMLKSLQKYGAIIVAAGPKEMIELANAIAPEHIELMVRQPEKMAKHIRNAGAMFLGPYSAPPLGDYLAGPNHVLPTGATARFFSALSLHDYTKISNIVHYTKEELSKVKDHLVRLAHIEGFDAHAKSAQSRFS